MPDWDKFFEKPAEPKTDWKSFFQTPAAQPDQASPERQGSIYPVPGESDATPVTTRPRATAGQAFSKLARDPLGYLKHVGEGLVGTAAVPGERFKEGMQGRPLVPSEELVPAAAGLAGMAMPATSFRSPVATPRAPVTPPPAVKLDEWLRSREPLSPIQLGEQAQTAIKRKMGVQTELKNMEYELAQSAPGEVPRSMIEGVGESLRKPLAEKMLVVDATTPQASQALKYLDSQVSHLEIKNKVTEGAPLDQTKIVGINLRGVEQVRKNLNMLYGRALRENPKSVDALIMKEIIKGFDQRLEQTVKAGLFSGDPKALAMLKQARASQSYAYKLYESKMVRDVIEGAAAPEQTATALLSMNKIGSTKEAVKAYNMLEFALGKKHPLMDEYRTTMWEQARGSVDDIAKLAQSYVGKKLYDAPQRRLMLEYANNPDKRMQIDPELVGRMVKMGTRRIPVVGKIPGVAPVIGKGAESLTRKLQKPKYGGVDE